MEPENENETELLDVEDYSAMDGSRSSRGRFAQLQLCGLNLSKTGRKTRAAAALGALLLVLVVAGVLIFPLCPSGYQCFDADDAPKFVAALRATCDTACLNSGLKGAKPASLYLRGGVIRGQGVVIGKPPRRRSLGLLVPPGVNVMMDGTAIKDHVVRCRCRCRCCCCCRCCCRRRCCPCSARASALCQQQNCADASITGLDGGAAVRRRQRGRHQPHLLRRQGGFVSLLL